MNELNQDIYICVKDKKAGTVHQFSSDINKFGNLHIAQATKDVTLQKIEQFTSQMAKMQDRLTVEDSSKDFSTDSKKDTEASSQGQKSEFVKIGAFDNQECSDSEQKFTDMDLSQAPNQFEIFDQKSHFELGDHRLN